MRWMSSVSRIVLVATTILTASPVLGQQTIVVAGGTTDTTAKTVGGTDSVTIQANGTLSVNANPAINWNSASTGLVITNSGIIRSTASGGRAINASGSANPRTITLTNNAGGLIESADDAFRINLDVASGTVRVDNFGIIRTTASGQALDFDAIASSTATVIINNFAGGELRSFGQDAIRSGQGAVITNGGLIYSDGPINNSYDGIDMQGHSATVINQASGTISGLRHGITSDVDLSVTNAGMIIGRNGSGVGSDGNGTVVNTGTITGSWDGVSTNGDGDGVDIDLIGTVRNSGIIRGISAAGVDSGGRPNSADGIAMGGGLIENNAGALISGGKTGILINDDKNPDGAAHGATMIVNAGRIEGLAGPAITMVGTFADSITNSGAIVGTGGIAVQMGAGNDSLTLLPGSVITGSVDGGTDSDTVTLGGAGVGSFAGAVNFERLAVTSGSWTLTAPSTFVGGTTVAGSALLTGDATTLTGAIANSGTVIVNQAAAGTLAAVLSGGGSLVKAGAGTLSIGAQPGFTGAIGVGAGRLDVTGALVSAVTVERGATLGGTGSLGALTVQSGGTVAPGLSVGTLSVGGPLLLTGGSIYAAEITAAGAADRIAVTGSATIQSGAILTITRGAGAYTPGTRYTLLTATGGLSGSYALGSTAADGTELRLGTTASALFVDVARTAASLVPVTRTPNQAATAAVVAGFTATNPIYAALTLLPADDGVRSGLDSLSGEIHASVRTSMTNIAAGMVRAALARGGEAADGSGLWGQLFVGTAEEFGLNGAADGRRKHRGGLGGIDMALGDVIRLGVAGGYTRDRLTVGPRASRATLKTVHLLGYVSANVGPLRLSAGAGHDWVKTVTSRSISFSGFSDQLSAGYDGRVLHGFAQAELPVALGAGVVRPFVGVSAYRTHTDGFVESGGPAALAGDARKDSYVQSTVGLKLATPIANGLSARGRIGWEHMFDDRTGAARLSFLAGGPAFAIAGTSLSRNAAAASLALTYAPNASVRISLGYDGHIGDAGTDSAGRLALAISF